MNGYQVIYKIVSYLFLGKKNTKTPQKIDSLSGYDSFETPCPPIYF